MNSFDKGRFGEQKARLLLQGAGLYIGQSDWIGLLDNKWYRFEIKCKDRFKPPPFEGHGLNLYQVNYGQRFQKDVGIPTILIVFDFETSEIFAQRLDVLEMGKYYDTRNGIRIYPLENFARINTPSDLLKVIRNVKRNPKK